MCESVRQDFLCRCAVSSVLVGSLGTEDRVQTSACSTEFNQWTTALLEQSHVHGLQCERASGTQYLDARPSQRKIYERTRVENRDRLNRELKEIDFSTSEILSEGGAGADRQRFCADLPSIRKREREELAKREKKAKQDKKILEAVREREEQERKKRNALGDALSGGEAGGAGNVGGNSLPSEKKMGRMARKKNARMKAQEQKDAR